MTSPSEDFVFEPLEDVIAARGAEAPSERGMLGRVAETGLFGPLATEEGRRQVARTGSRIGETILGLPGDIAELFSSIAIGVPEYFAGEELPSWRMAVEGRKGLPDEPAGLGFPTSKEIRERIVEDVGEGYLEPQSEWERFGDEVAQDFAALALPVKGKIPFARALGSSVIANAGGEVAKAFGGEKAEAFTKMGLLFATGMMGGKQPGVKQHIRNLYKEMEASVPSGANVSASNLSSKLDKISAVLRKGDPADLSKAAPFEKISAIKDKIKSGFIDVDEVVELTKSVNESIFGLGELKRGQNKLYDIRKALHETAREYGAQNPEFLSKWTSANEAYAATEMSRKVKNFVKKNVRPRDYLHAVSALGIEGAVAGAPAAAMTLGGAAAAAGTAYSAEVMKRIAQSPALRRYYMNVVNNSLKDNKGGFLRAMKQLDKGLEKSFEQEPYETFEID